MKSLPIAVCLLAIAASPASAQTGLKVVDQIKIGGAGGWDYATFDADTRMFYVSHGSTISAVNADTKTVSSALVSTQGAHIAVPYNNGKTLMVTNGGSNTVTINDATTGALQATISTDANPDAAVVDSYTGRGFVMANRGGAVDVIDLEAKTVLAKISIGGTAEGGAFDGAGLVFAHVEDKNAIAVIDAKSMTLKTTYPMPDCTSPSGIAFIPGKRWILSACRGGIARITDADTGAEVATVPIGNRPDFALYDVKRKLGYVPSGDGKLTVIDFSGAKPVIAETIDTPVGARTGALDAQTGRVYLPTADFGPAPQAGGRAPALPDTFRVVVVGK